MVPIVDAGVGLSQKYFVLGDYLKAFKQFHVLRLVAVQRPQAVETALQELQYFQTQASTRGSGGFPNAIVANVDLFSPDAIARLVKINTLENMRGVYHNIKQDNLANDRSGWQQSLDLLVQSHLNLELSIQAQHDQAVQAMAAYQPQLNFIAELAGSLDCHSQLTHTTKNRRQRLADLAKHKNIHLKICATQFCEINNVDVCTAFIEDALDHFGNERIMFASGLGEPNLPASIDQLWSLCVQGCSGLSASCRDKLFRTNAIRLYAL